MADKKTIKANVEMLMEKYEICRNDDIELIWKYWEWEGTVTIQQNENDNYITKLGMKFYATSVKRIIRCRAIIQNDEKKLLPTEWNVAKKRRIERDDWMRFMGYPVKEKKHDNTAHV